MTLVMILVRFCILDRNGWELSAEGSFEVL